MTPKEEIKQSLLTLSCTSHWLDIDLVVAYILEREKAQVAKVINPIRKYEGALGCYATDALRSIHKSLAIADEILGGEECQP